MWNNKWNDRHIIHNATNINIILHLYDSMCAQRQSKHGNYNAHNTKVYENTEKELSVSKCEIVRAQHVENS